MEHDEQFRDEQIKQKSEQPNINDAATKPDQDQHRLIQSDPESAPQKRDAGSEREENLNAEDLPSRSNYEIHYHKNPNQHFVVRILYVILGSAMAAFGMNLFLENVGLLPSGFVGLSILIQRFVLVKFGVEIPFIALNVFFNIGPAIYVFFKLGKRFAILSIISLVTTSALLDIIPVFHLTDDMFISTVMSAVIVGFSYVLVYNADASGGGLDFITMSLSNKYKISVFNYVMLFNFSILAVSAVYFSLEAALYSIVFQFITTQIKNRGHIRYQRKTCFIVTETLQPLADDLMRMTHHGITVAETTGCYSGKKQYFLYMVVSRGDIRLIRRYLSENAPHTFLNITDSEQLNGNFYIEPID